jgi:hypothetical protein
MNASVSSGRLLLTGLGLLCLLAAGCASSGGGVTTANSDVITRQEIEETGVGDLYQAVERLRPLWLRSRGSRSLTSDTEIAVVRDGSYFGPVESLRTIPAEQVFELEYVDAATVASLLPGRVLSDHVIEAAILVRLGQAPR